MRNRKVMTFQTPAPSQSIDSNYWKNPINVGQLVSAIVY